MQFGIGQPVTRKEDPRFLAGRARYVADIDLARQVYAVFLYSPHAHARIAASISLRRRAFRASMPCSPGQHWSADGLCTLDPEFMPEDMGEIRKKRSSV
jgi:carbon-monoxide dehydrogenase large subunit